MLTEKQIKTIRSVESGRYDCLYSDIVSIRDAEGGSVLDTGSTCFCYGFLKGQRAERAAAKKRALREIENHAPGYGLLMTLVEKNMSNERFVRLMAAFAHSLTEKSDTAEGERTKEGA